MYTQSIIESYQYTYKIKTLATSNQTGAEICSVTPEK